MKKLLLIVALLTLAFSKPAFVKQDIQVLDVPAAEFVWLHEGDFVSITAVDLDTSPLECRVIWDEYNQWGDFVYRHWTWTYGKYFEFTP